MNVQAQASRMRMLFVLGLLAVFVLAGCASAGNAAEPVAQQDATPESDRTPVSEATQEVGQVDETPPPTGQIPEDLPSEEGPASYVADVTFTLETNIDEGMLVFVGVGGEIDGVTNPTLQVALDDVVQIILVNGDGAVHDIVLPDFDAASEQITGQGTSTAIVFRANQEGEYVYFCSLPGHRQAGMEGMLVVGEAEEEPAAQGVSIVLDPAQVPEPVGDRPPQTVQVEMESIELEGRLADGTSYHYWTFNGTVPGPMIRVREGDTVEVTLTNRDDSMMIHSIDLHAVTGPGGGAEVTQVAPGEGKSFTFRALQPGLYVYHCATPMVASHIANGMYGLILVEPEGGLPPVDREYYVMQGEIYTEGAFGQPGHQEHSIAKLIDEEPEYFVLNGAVGALTEERPLQANVGETIRIFYGVGGPNFVSSFHVIGEIFDRVYDQASLTAAPLTDVQTTLVPAGGATMVELTLDVPGRYILVDHALSRVEKGLIGFLYAEGPENPEIFRSGTSEP